jgi:tRNA pseudouridine38-40 synthase
MPRYFIKLAYKGTHFHGWQKQENAPTIQQELENALSILLSTPIETIGCGRTDTGVHARQFYAHFEYDAELNDEKFVVYKLNRILPPEICIYSIFKVKDGANARFDALSRTYQYFISRSKNPFEQDTTYYLYGILDIGKMNRASQLLLNYEDFTSFSKSNTQVLNNKCKIYKAEWYQKADQFIFEIKANRFLRNMVRAIVGTLIQVGKGEITEQEFTQIIDAKNRSEAGFSVPAEGLFLTHIEYPDSIFL